MEFDADIVAALGEDRINRALAFLRELEEIAAAAPDKAFSVLHSRVPLTSGNDVDAAREFAEILTRRTPGLRWATATMVDGKGHRFGRATLYPPRAMIGTVEWFILFSLFDVHTRLGAYWLTNIWRALELTQTVVKGLGDWHVIVSAACSRSLLEGAAALHVNVRKLVKEWDSFKSAGKPNMQALGRFERTFTKLVLRPQYVTRIAELQNIPNWLRSPNVLSYIEKISNEMPNANILGIYDWLCDAVHPSFGSTESFTIERGMHDSKTHFVEVYARKPFSRGHAAIRHDVACASGDAIAAVAALLPPDLALLRWLLDDIGLTSGVAFGHPTAIDFRVPVARIGSLRSPERNEVCPCGSGKKFKKCTHTWGLAGTPPAG